MRVPTSWRGPFGVALFGFALGCGATSHDVAPRGDGGSPAAGSSASGGREPSSSGGVTSDAGAGRGSQTVGGLSSAAGSGMTQAGASGGSESGETGAGGVSGVAGAGGTGGTGGTGEDPNKVVLFDGSEQTFNSWYPRNRGTTGANPWTNNGDGTMTVKNGSGDILTKVPFTNVFVHLEYWSQNFDYPRGVDFRQRAASGVYLKGSYELVILDTFGVPPEDVYADQYCGAIFTISKPLVSACKPGGEWNAYDIEFRAEICTNGVKTTNAEFVEVRLNGIPVQQNVAVDRPTQAGLTETCEPRGVMLRDVSTLVPVSFRNIWAIPRK